jgi:hypothetical protein
MNIPALQTQKNHRELELIIQECILNAVRESIPIDMILRAYLDETTEDDVIEEIKEEPIAEDKLVENIVESNTAPASTQSNLISSKLSFNNVDMAIDANNKEEEIVAPKDIERLESISNIRNEQRKLETDDDDDDDNKSNSKIRITNDTIKLDNLDVHDIEPQSIEIIPDLLIDDIEVLG